MSDSLERSPNVAMVFERLAARAGAVLLATPDGEVSALAVLERAKELESGFVRSGVGPGAICAFEGDYAPDTIATFLALMRIGAIAVPFSAGASAEREELSTVAAVDWVLDVSAGTAARRAIPPQPPHPLVAELISLGHPGLIVFTSGSTGKPKAILHDIDRIAAKFAQSRPGWRMVMFLLIDHFGGFNTLMSVLANDGVGVCPRDRSPRAICEAIAGGGAELLPTTPTFLGMLIASGLWREYSLDSIRLVTYGAEPMPPVTLARMREILPKAQFKQTYGLSELGVLRSSSPDQDSLWLKVGGVGFETRVVEGQLQVRSASTMMGYINAPSPVDAEGWMDTGDLVEEKDGLIRFLGRRSEIINVGGQKVLPAEIEDILLEAEGVTASAVFGTRHALLGQAVVARVALSKPEEPKRLTERLRDHCRQRMQKFKIPMRFEIVDETSLSTARAKKNRAPGGVEQDREA